MKKRLMANMRDDDEDKDNEQNADSNTARVPNTPEIESIDQSLQSNRAQIEPGFAPLSDHRSRSITPQSPATNSFVPPPPRRQTSLVREAVTSVNAADSWDPTYVPFSNSTWTPDISSVNSSPGSQPSSRNVYGRTPPPKINLGQELWQDRNPILTPSRNLANQPPTNDTLDSIWKAPVAQPPPVWDSVPASSSFVNNGPSNSPTTHPSPIGGLHVTRQVPIRVQYADDERVEPTQSKSFKLLQRMTAGIEDELQQLRLVQPPPMQQTSPQKLLSQPAYIESNGRPTTLPK